MKNVTVAIDEDTHRAARIRAAELGTSLSALVKDYLQTLGTAPAAEGVREMPTTFAAQPGPSKSNVPLADDLDEWPQEMLDFFEKLQTEPFEEPDFEDLLLFDEKQLPSE